MLLWLTGQSVQGNIRSGALGRRGERQSRGRTWTEIERRIVCGEMAAGERLDEDALAGQLEVDPPVVREALCRLERDGFVRPEDGGSFAVAPLTEIEVREEDAAVIRLDNVAVRGER